MSEASQTQTLYKHGDTMPNGKVFDVDNHRILANGAVYDNVRKHIVAAPPPEMRAINKSTGKALALQRWQAAREEFAAGVAEGLTGREDAPLKAWRRVGTKAAELLDKAQSARSYADLARFVGESAGFIAPPRGREDDDSAAGQEQAPTMTLISQLIIQLAPPASTDNGGSVVDGTVISDGNE